jgi:hypothetical protein
MPETLLRFLANNVSYILSDAGPFAGLVDPTNATIEFDPHWANYEPGERMYYQGPDHIRVY